MKPKDPTAPKHAHYHEHDPLPPGLLDVSPSLSPEPQPEARGTMPRTFRA